MGLNKRLIGAGATASGGLTPSENFKAVTYTGNGGTQSITGVGFQPDLVWLKNREGTTWHNVTDSSRGAGKQIATNSNADEEYNSAFLTSFDSDGFSLGAANGYNNSGVDFIAWCWKANEGTTSSNTDGSITSTVQANTDAGFSIATYTGSGSTATIGHGLSAAPEMIIAKSTSDAYEWKIWHKDLSSGYQILFNTAAQASDSSVWTTTTPTSTVFSIGTNVGVNGGSKNYVAYCFKSIDGFSKIGSYTGTGTTGNAQVCGFEPAFLLSKRISSTSDWYIIDNKRNTTNPRNNFIDANTSGAEYSPSYGVNFNSNGFSFISTDLNGTGQEWIYIAFAADPDTEQPTLASSFDIQTYNMTGGSDYDLSFAFKPQFVITKTRDEAAHWSWGDIIRGNNSNLSSNDTNAVNTSNQWRVKDWYAGATSVTIAQHASTSTSNVSYAWKADDNEPTINTEGSIDSLVSANANAGFSVVKYVGNGSSGSTIGHGLSAAPELIIAKNLQNTTAWGVYVKYNVGSSNNPASERLTLQTSDATTTTTVYWGGTEPTSSVFTVGTENAVNQSGYNTIAYCFHSVSGYSKIGSYTGTGATGNTVTVGFQPDFVMVKSSSTTEPWFILDSARDTSNPRDNRLMPDSSAAEDDGSVHTMDFNSTSFTLNGTVGNGTNGNGQTYIYMAIKMN